MNSIPNIAIIDYGMGNVHSVITALRQVNSALKIFLTDDADTILQASHIIFPGVGSIEHCLLGLKKKS